MVQCSTKPRRSAIRIPLMRLRPALRTSAAVINLNRFDLVSLRLFVAVVDAGSLTAGAERFGVSLAAASKRIAELEQHCGITLLQRSQRGVTATEGGQTLHRHAIEVVARLEQLAQAVDDMRSGSAGQLRLCANPSSFGGFLPALLARYAAAYPNVKIDLTDALSEDGVRAVQSGIAELAIIGDNVPHEGLETFVCNVDELVLIVPGDHPLAGRSSVAVAQALSSELVALPRTASLTRHVIAAAEAAGMTVRIRVQVRSFDVMCRMVARGLGVAVLPRAAAQLFARTLGLSLVRLEGASTERRLLLAMRQQSQLSAAALALVHMMREDLPPA